MVMVPELAVDPVNVKSITLDTVSIDWPEAITDIVPSVPTVTSDKVSGSFTVTSILPSVVISLNVIEMPSPSISKVGLSLVRVFLIAVTVTPGNNFSPSDNIKRSSVGKQAVVTQVKDESSNPEDRTVLLGNACEPLDTNVLPVPNCEPVGIVCTAPVKLVLGPKSTAPENVCVSVNVGPVVNFAPAPNVFAPTNVADPSKNGEFLKSRAFPKDIESP